MDILKTTLNTIQPQIKQLYETNKQLIETAPGSSNNHQNWKGGYKGHIEETLGIAKILYESLSTHRKLTFTLEDVNTVILLHDIEKPFKYGGKNKYKMLATNNPKTLKELLIKEYGISLTNKHYNALENIHGEENRYRKDKRVMGELAAFCHMCDVWSARGWYDQPKKDGGLNL